MTAENVGVNIRCESNCFQWCPRSIHCCCGPRDHSSDDESALNASADEVAREALRHQQTKPERPDRKPKCCVIQ